MSDMRRREFITLLGGAAATWPLTARAQQPGKLPVIGYLGPESPAVFASRVRAFRQGLGETGYAEGRNVAIEFRWAEGQHNRLPALAADLVARQAAVIVAPGGAPGGLAAKSATTTIPIVFEMGADPVAIGLVDNLNRPGGNLTGVSSLNVQVTPKRLEIRPRLRLDIQNSSPLCRRNIAPPPPKPRGGPRALAGERSEAIRLAVRDHHTRSLGAESPAQSEQWCCWFGRRRIISGSAENRGSSRPSAIDRRPRKHRR
jgi:hypothetical protein